MNILLTKNAEADISYWNKTAPEKTAKIKALLADILQHPFTGLGKPEPLKYELTGCYSRRIDLKNRLVYKVDDDGETVIVLQCRYHY